MMPELPDVETFKRYFDATSLHQRIQRIHVVQPFILKGLSPQSLGRKLHGRCFEQTRRHGKYLFAGLDHDEWLVMHFGMTGNLRYFKVLRNLPDFTDLLFEFENGFHLAYVAPRKLGLITVISDPDEFIGQQKLGPDALNLDFPHFRELPRDHRGMVKSWLMNQKLIAGIGNIYGDEILFQAGIHPKTDITKLDENQLKGLFDKMQAVLITAIEAKAAPQSMPDTFLLPHRKQDGRCPKCNTSVQQVSISGRTAYFCPRCQPRTG